MNDNFQVKLGSEGGFNKESESADLTELNTHKKSGKVNMIGGDGVGGSLFFSSNHDLLGIQIG
jgi:hypothetical protein